MDYQSILNTINDELSYRDVTGKVASYIPELAKVDPRKFGMHVYCGDRQHFSFGDSEELFSIQSISKVFSLSMAMRIMGEDLWDRVDVEPSGDPFNSLSQLEYESGVPRNPFINAGALVISDILVDQLEDPKQELLDFVRKITEDNSINFDLKIAASERSTGYRNVALVNYMKALGNIKCEVEPIVDFYFHLCSLAMSCKQLAQAFMIFANKGKILSTDEEILTPTSVKRINSLMQTCGFYDEAGEFSFEVGLPGKSGVGGGIVAIHPDQYSVAVWSPILNEKGNSELGMKALERLTSLTGLSVF
ncbi:MULTISPECIES: glutaminase [Salegentibacter]|jgi:glutaminase|uniref:Glutaminase n=1 Tax=Salegentibacter agarivorans TaxID=345907 RepID=A0A1I2JYK4_9FLAO|nr:MULTISPECIES: glutaminase [Salegentibacter]APS39046.1 glutaminase A [Salegentibacter sp. T436]SFF57881.1 L-glutaminase [Salegentibacter agarivorans]|tara:strand:- start:357 stop:1271 length:915 start_codon:yes stop_codon:yes gene_type:complete